MCECYQVGGQFIAEDPSCPIHGESANGREFRIECLIERVVARELPIDEAVTQITEEFI